MRRRTPIDAKRGCEDELFHRQERERAERRAAELRRLVEALGLGVEFGRPAHTLLESWLVRRPEPELFAAWREWVRGAPGQARLLLEAAERVAGAAGGLQGFGMVRRAERRAIDGIHHSLAGAGERPA